MARLVSPQGVARVNADPDNVTGMNVLGVKRTDRFVAEDGVAERGRRCGGEDAQPSGRDYRRAKSRIAGIN
jgi:hypothetical protein